jgi:hypothetical protein
MSSHALPSLLLLSAAMLPALVHAEGAVRIFECNITQECDGDGACKGADQKVEFRMEPIERATDGSGTYTIHYDDQSADMQALSEAGPFYWQQDSERNTLLASSDTRFLWHRLFLAAAPVAQVRFLECAVRQ